MRRPTRTAACFARRRAETPRKRFQHPEPGIQARYGHVLGAVIPAEAMRRNHRRCLGQERLAHQQVTLPSARPSSPIVASTKRDSFICLSSSIRPDGTGSSPRRAGTDRFQRQAYTHSGYACSGSVAIVSQCSQTGDRYTGTTSIPGRFEAVTATRRRLLRATTRRRPGPIVVV